MREDRSAALVSFLKNLRGRKLHVMLNRGNAGDGLIHLGGRQLFRRLGLETREFVYPAAVRGQTLLLYGNGSFCATSSHRVGEARHYFDRFEEIVILPSSFDARQQPIAGFLESLPGHVTIFCREKISYGMCEQAMSDRSRLHLSEDLAFSFDYAPWRRNPGQGTIIAFRTDAESSLKEVPRCSIDVSRYGDKHDGWPLLYTLSRFREVHTDRTHVGVAAAMLGKRTFLHDNSYHKNRAIYEHSLADMDNVTYMGSRIPDVQAGLKDEIRMRSLHALMRLRKPLFRLYANPGRRKFRKADP